MENVLLGQVPGSQEFGPAPVETKRPIDQPPFPGGGAQADSGAPSGGGGAKVTDKPTIVESYYDPGFDVDTKVDTSTKGDTPPATPPDVEDEPKAPNYLMIAGGLALLYFLFKRKK